MARESQTGRNLRVSVLLLAAASYLITVCFYAPERAMLAMFSDDAFYYFKIANNIANGRGSTFDLIAPTNGYHPLWMLLMVLVYSLFGATQLGPVIFVMGLLGMGTLCTLALVYRTVQRFVAPGYGPLAVAACLLPNVLTAMFNGMETGILLLACSGMVYFAYAKDACDVQAPPSISFRFGLLLGLVFLCRLDSLFLMVSVGLLTVAGLIVRQLSIRAFFLRAVTLLAGALIPAIPFFAWNALSFGHLLPISGAVKGTFPAVRTPLAFGDDMLFGAVLLLVVTGMTAVVAICDPRRQGDLRRIIGSPLLMMTLSCGLHFLYAYLFMSWGVYWWHFAVYGLTFALVLPPFAQAIVDRVPNLRAAILIGGTTLLILVGGVTQLAQLTIKNAQHRGWLEAARWARENTDENAVLALKDAGLFGYFSGRRTINLDGKANSYGYLSSLQDGSVEDYLHTVGVRYVAEVNTNYSDGHFFINIARAKDAPIVLDMLEKNEVYRSPSLPARLFKFGVSPTAHFAIWRFPAPPEPAPK